MRLEDLEAHVRAHEVEWPIRAHELPTDPDTCLAFRGYGGEPGRYRDDDGRPTDDYPRFQVLVRDPDDLTAESMARNLWEIMHGKHTIVGAARVLWLEALQRPVLMRKDESGRFVYVFNIVSHTMIGD